MRTKALIEDLYAQKASDQSGVPVEYILKLRDRGWLDQMAIRNALIQYDYWTLAKTGRFKESQLLAKLADLYNLAQTTIVQITRIKQKRLYFCTKCGCEISKRKYDQNQRLCDKCFSKRIII